MGRVKQKCLKCGKKINTTYPVGFHPFCSGGCEAAVPDEPDVVNKTELWRFFGPQLEQYMTSKQIDIVIESFLDKYEVRRK